MSDMIKREDVLTIIEGRFSGLMIGDILKQDINALPEADIRTAGRQCKIDRCELFNRLATITGEDANDMKAKIYAVIQEMPASEVPVVLQIDKEKLTRQVIERISKGQLLEMMDSEEIKPRRGSWEVRPAPSDDWALGRKRYYCSACGSWNSYGMPDYCPSCGAYMKNEEIEPRTEGGGR